MNQPDQHGIDLDAYFTRIGCSAERTPTLALLRELVARHTASITFENIDPVARRVPLLDLASLQDKLVGRQRGGYCYEQNTLFQAVLCALGFQVTGLMSRVRRGVPAHVTTPRSHMLLLVDLPEGQYLADVGFGGMTPTAPLALQADMEQATPNEVFRLCLLGDEFMLQAGIGGEWQDIYLFGLLAQQPIDYEVVNWHTATRPNAMFADNLIITRPAPGVRRTLFNRHFTLRRMNGVVERQVLLEPGDYRRVLVHEFGLQPSEEEFGAIMDLVARHDPDQPNTNHFA